MIMARAATTPTRRAPSAVGAAKSSANARGVSSRPRPPTGAPSVRLLALPCPPPPRKRACACSPTTHPGSFRCALHRGQVGRLLPSSSAAPAPVPSRLSTIRWPSSTANPLARVAAVGRGESVRRRRRDAFRPRPSRLSAVSSAADDDEPPRRFQ